eukprot:TRINITY_DN1218_c0_g1_i1.p2 TRINITY_DN1218_c0_g1~~TRINITY_DN1218_c0_g1_i1.p2  ORF type:complete len:333 (-),score=136.35 TRINITY_DN1218_c0_g1_i1:252-1250(-)
MAPAAKKQQADLRKIKSNAKATVKATKKADKVAAAKADGKTMDVLRRKTNVVVTGALTAEAGRPEPPYNFAIHVKNSQVLVDITLHNVPPQCLDLEKSTTRRLVVDCAKHTKKYLLEFDLPHNMTMDVEKSDFTFESGILKCVLQCGSTPAEAIKERETFIGKVRKERNSRFRVTTTGETVVRVRRSKLNMDEAPKVAAKVAAVATALATEDKKADKKDGKKASKDGKVSAPPKENQKPSKYVSDDAMRNMAKAAETVVKRSLIDRVKAASEVQKRREQVTARRSERKTVVKDKKSEAFQRVIEDQRQQLANRAALAAPVKKSQSGKKIKFE